MRQSQVGGPIRVAIVGPESSGKSTLAEAWAERLRREGRRAAWVAEYSRAYYADRPYISSMADIEAIAAGQLTAEARAACGADILLCDTTVLTCKIWAEVAFGRASPALLRLYRPQDYALTLLTRPDMPWQADPLRSHPTQRDWLLDLHRRELADMGIAAVELAGGPEERLERAGQALLPLLAA
ncbi:AAA family ATPase [Chromobacterium sphagni]|uniref:Nicotinamide mononucleotide-binding protein n=1 Tax=Chromobacterium sphagni TaxID=1903179 RepID=A0A1S1X4V0_9NEIS|nr:ATP-binding protein [Chromobacterium sphagni]OHX14494.1 nicotinamide mononucleotide-binding protein [Chromobacterium sphagni]OHX20574.1 nicotinamide mononucleotide-binding protein [Chromobacterium sphagni]